MYRDLREAGFSRASAIIMVAVGLGESGGNDTAVGDVGLEDSTWGPSVGIYQVRTLKGKTGSGGDRDISSLMGDPDHQALAAWDISSKGTDFTPWSVYTSGKYQEFLGQARAAADQVGDAGFVTVDNGLSDLLGGIAGSATGSTAPLIGNTLSDALSGILPSFRDGAIQLAFAALGITLVGVGLARTVAPKISQTVKSVAGAA